MRHLYVKSNTLLFIFCHFTTDVKLVLFDSHCTSLYCPFLGTGYTKRTFSKLSVAFNMHIERYLISHYGVVQVQCMPKTTSVTLKQCYVIYRFIQRLQDSDNSLIQCICKS